MYVLDLYQLEKSGRWRWKLITESGRVVARADYHYATKSHALRAFKGMKKVLEENFIPVAVWRSKEKTYWKDI
jgi:uncharacterized protein YegP (UPF0339 family)